MLKLVKRYSSPTTSPARSGMALNILEFEMRMRAYFGTSTLSTTWITPLD